MILFLAILLFCSSAQAFKIVPDRIGIKGRAGVYFSTHEVKLDNGDLILNDQDRKQYEKFPLMIAFEPSNGRYWFSQWFFDYELPNKSENLNPATINRTNIFNNFMTASEQAFATANPNWTLSADFETWALVSGYQVGLFLPLNDRSRLAKIGIGLSFGWYDYDVTLSLCSDFIPGQCPGQTAVERFRFSGLGIGLITSVVLYEWQGKDWLFQFINFEAGSIVGLTDQTVESRVGDPKFDISSTLLSSDIFKVAYFFSI